MKLGARKNVTGHIWQTVFVTPSCVEGLLLTLLKILVSEIACDPGFFCILLVLPLILPNGSAFIVAGCGRVVCLILFHLVRQANPGMQRPVQRYTFNIAALVLLDWYALVCSVRRHTLAL